MSLPGLRGLGAWDVVKGALKKFNDDEMSTYAAALAYRVLLSIFPFLIFLVALLAFLRLPDLFAWLREQAALIVPSAAINQVNNVIDELQAPKVGLLSVGIGFAVWSAAAGVVSLMNALNTAYDVPEARPAWKRLPLALLYTLGLAGMLIAAAALMVIGPQVAQWVADRIGFGQLFVTLWTWLRWPVTLFLLVLAVAIVYHFTPNTAQRFRLFTPGAGLAVAGWIAASLGFGLYVSKFGQYSATYGSLGAIVVLLLYFYISAAVLLFGAEINAEIEQRSPRAGDPRAQASVPDPKGARVPDARDGSATN